MNATSSVVMCTYNGEKYIAEQLESIRCQTCEVSEVVICDDRSTDNTVEIIQNYIDKYNLQGWSVEVNETNLGYGSNFYKALSKATGEFIFFSDQDDIWMLNKIEIMIDLMNKNQDMKLLCSEYEVFSTGDQVPEYAKYYGKNNLSDKSLEKIELSPHNFFIGSLGCDMCVRKSFLKEIEPYWFEGWAQDEYVWKLAQCADGCYMYHDSLIRHRVHATNVSMHKIHDINKRIQFLVDLKKGNESCKRYVEDTTGNKKYLKIIEKNIKSQKMRINMMRTGKVYYTIPLLFYGRYYHSRKSLLMEPWIALKNHKDVREGC